MESSCKFTTATISSLKEKFISHASWAKNLNISDESFCSCFPYFNGTVDFNGVTIWEAFMKVFTKNIGVTFDEFLTTIQIFVTGDVKERVQRTVRMMESYFEKDVRDGREVYIIKKKDFVDFLQKLSRSMKDNTDVVNILPGIIVQQIFQVDEDISAPEKFDLKTFNEEDDQVEDDSENEKEKNLDSKEVEALEYESFLEKCENCKSIVNCFNIFQIFWKQFLSECTPITHSSYYSWNTTTYQSDSEESSEEEPENRLSVSTAPSATGAYNVSRFLEAKSQIYHSVNEVQSNHSNVKMAKCKTTAFSFKDVSAKVGDEAIYEREQTRSTLNRSLSEVKRRRLTSTEGVIAEKIESVSERSYEGILKKGHKKYFAKVINGFLILYDIDSRTKIEDFHIIQPESMKISDAIEIKAEFGSVKLWPEDENDIDKWRNAITVYTSWNSHHSFAEERIGVGAEFFSTGKQYYLDLIENLKKAKESIYITGWQLSAKVLLSRENNSGESLLDILKNRADAQVKIYIAIWAGVPLLVNTASEAVRKLLKHENIYTICDSAGLIPSIFSSLTSFATLNSFYSHHQKTCVIDGKIGYVGGIDITYGRWDDDEFNLIDENTEKKYPLLDYYNPMAGLDDINDNKPINELENELRRKYLPRHGWNDAHIKVVGKVVLDLERNFIQRWEKARQKDLRNVDGSKIPIIVPHSEPDSNSQPSLKYNNCNAQVLRSAPEWGFHFGGNENSLYQGQCAAIENAKHFIYIENQFFISSATPGVKDSPNNLLLECLTRRITKAHNDNRPFKVVILLPCQPNFKASDLACKSIVDWQHASVYRGVFSLAEALKAKNNAINLDDYVHIMSCRTYGRFTNGKVTSEIIYVHSKVLIVDDDVAFISSCNINDRSLLGCRDSEIGVKITDSVKVAVPFGKEIIQCSKIAHDFRVSKMKLMLGNNSGVSDEDLENPFTATNIWCNVANSNSNLFKELFPYDYSNITSTRNLNVLTNYQERTKVMTEEEQEKLKGIKGFLVNFPRNFILDVSDSKKIKITKKFAIFRNIFT